MTVNTTTMRFVDKVAVVTGAGEGIGKATVLRFAQEGAKITLNDVNLSSVEYLREKLKEEGKREVLTIKANVSQRTEIESMFNQVMNKFGRIDILVNNAGIRKDAPIHRLSQEEWREVLATNLDGSFHCAQVASNYMIKQNYGKIINISSPFFYPFLSSSWGQVNYQAASTGLEGLTRALAWELGPYNININCISPQFIDTNMTRENVRKMGMYLEDYKKTVVSQIPLKRQGTADDVANLVLFLASDESSFITGQVIHIKGGP